MIGDRRPKASKSRMTYCLGNTTNALLHRINSMQARINSMFCRTRQILSWRMTPPLHLCIIPVMLGFAGACWLTACICPIPRFAGLGVFASLLSPIVATVFAVWIQFRTRKKTKTALESRFALLFGAGAISGLLAMTTLLQCFLPLPLPAKCAICAVLLTAITVAVAEATSKVLQRRRVHAN